MMLSFHGQDIDLTSWVNLQPGKNSAVEMHPLWYTTEVPVQPDLPLHPMADDFPDLEVFGMESFNMLDFYTTGRNTDPSVVLPDDGSRLASGFEDAQTQYNLPFLHSFPELLEGTGQFWPVFPEVAEHEADAGLYGSDYSISSNAFDATGELQPDIALLPGSMPASILPSTSSSFPPFPADSSVPADPSVPEWPPIYVAWGNPLHRLVSIPNGECANLTDEKQTSSTNTDRTVRNDLGPQIVHDDAHFYPPLTPPTGLPQQFAWRLYDGATVDGPLPARHTTAAQRGETRAIRNAGGACDACRIKKCKCDLGHVLASSPAATSTATASTSAPSSASSFILVQPEDAMP